MSGLSASQTFANSNSILCDLVIQARQEDLPILIKGRFNSVSSVARKLAKRWSCWAKAIAKSCPKQQPAESLKINIAVVLLNP